MAELKFVPFVSDIELPFYSSLASRKLEVDQLDDSVRRVLGLYEYRPGGGQGTSCRIQLHGNALISNEIPAGFFRAEGLIQNTNTIEDYLALDTAMIMNRAGALIWDSINNGSIFESPSLLVSFVMVCFSDLKRYKFTYHFAFPALHSEPSWLLADGSSSSNPAHVGRFQLKSGEIVPLIDNVQAWRRLVDPNQHGFFLAKRLKTTSSPRDQVMELSMAPSQRESTSEVLWQVESLRQYEHGFFNGAEEEDCFVCFADPSTDPTYPGWMLRNLLVLVRQRWALSKVQVLCYRVPHGRHVDAQGLVLRLSCRPDRPDGMSPSTVPAKSSALPKVTGWERKGGKVASKVANLGEHMDPTRLAEQAVDLNLKLMKWRIAPALDLDRIKSAKCLLLGAGTLGSHVARNLMAWGVKKITFVDNGKVSFSNPVRQPLFVHDDCLAGGVAKAPRAAQALTDIFPGVDSSGHVFSVPMAGHPILDEAKAKDEYTYLEGLIRSHDIIFLLMDTRESRWLPTVIGKATNKLIMNAALGFDSFVVMRHGGKGATTSGEQLGCYFCNDVVAPADSTTNRTLDQQCTVTRPAVSAVAAALLVEIMVSVLQHPAVIDAPASRHGDKETGDHPLGLVPHQIRGFLSNFQNLIVCGNAYDCCSACSRPITDAYSASGWDFVKRALTEKGFMEDLSGLLKVQAAAENAALDIEWDDESD